MCGKRFDFAGDARDAFGVAEVVEDEKAFLPDSADEDRVVVAVWSP